MSVKPVFVPTHRCPACGDTKQLVVSGGSWRDVPEIQSAEMTCACGEVMEDLTTEAPE